MAGGTVRPAPVGRVWAWTTKTGSLKLLPQNDSCLVNIPLREIKNTRKRNKSKILNHDDLSLSITIPLVQPWWSVFVKIFTTFFRLPRLFRPLRCPTRRHLWCEAVPVPGTTTFRPERFSRESPPRRLRTSVGRNFFGDVKGYENTGFC